MTKRLVYLSAFLSVLISCFFIFKIAERSYFNEKYYNVPDIRGFSPEEAKEALKHEDLNIKVIGEEYSHYPLGEIFLQEPESGQIAKVNRNIRVWVSKGTALVEMPNLVGMNFLEAKSIVEQKGLVIDRVVTSKINKPINEVISTDPPTDTLMRRGDKISFLISGNERHMDVKVPDLIGKDLEQAKAELIEQSLVVGKISYKTNEALYNGVIIGTGVEAGVTVKTGTPISLTVNKSKMEKPIAPPPAADGDAADTVNTTESDADGTDNTDEDEGILSIEDQLKSGN